MSKGTDHFSGLDDVLAQIGSQISNYSGHHVGSLGDYPIGSFAQMSGGTLQELNFLAQNTADTARTYKTLLGEDPWSAVKAEKKDDRKYQTAVKKAEDKQKEEGWEKLGIDVAFGILGAAITVATCGAAAPAVTLGITLLASTTSIVNVASDVHQGFTGKEKNYAVDWFEQVPGMNTKSSEVAWSGISIVTSAVGDGGVLLNATRMGRVLPMTERMSTFGKNATMQGGALALTSTTNVVAPTGDQTTQELLNQDEGFPVANLNKIRNIMLDLARR